MIDLNTIKTALWTWVNTYDFPFTVIWSRQDAPAPSIPYTTLYISSISMVGQDYLGTPGVDEEAVIEGNREFTLEIQVFGPGALQRAETISSTLSRPTVLDTLRLSGIVFVESNPVLDITSLQEPNFEERASVDIRFRVASVDSDTLGLIEEVSSTGTLKDETGQTRVVESFNVSTN